jgi:hypothetical protein
MPTDQESYESTEIAPFKGYGIKKKLSATGIPKFHPSK